MHASTFASSPDGAAGLVALMAGSLVSEPGRPRRCSDSDYFRELKSWRNDETIWWSAMEFLEKELDGCNEDELTFCAVNVRDDDHAAQFRANMRRIAHSLGVNMGENPVFSDAALCSIDAIWTMPVVIAERLAALEGGWSAFESRPLRETPPDERTRTAILVDASTGHTVPTPPWGWHRKRF